LFIRSSGKVTGNVEFSEIEVEKGGNLQGTLTKINGSSSI
jgi:cytoskeletal protein CcmA (bactofilin family)